MKRKYFRVLTALVLALSLSLVMAVPAAAAVSTATVNVAPTTVGRAAEYTLGFYTTEDLYSAATDTIKITFPTGTTVPDADITAAKVTVNGVACTVDVVTVVDESVTIKVPQEVLTAGLVTVVIDVGAGIENPGTVATTWTLEVQTSQEPVDVESVAYSTTAVVAPTIVSVVGTAYQNSNDTIVITFSEAVAATWADAFTSIKCGGSALTLTNADLAYAAKVLTITLAEAADGDHLEIGTDNLEATPASGEIANAYADAWVSVTPVLGSVTGDSVDPTVALTYSDTDRLVKEGDSLTITAAFSEAMADTPSIAIDTQGTDLEAVSMAYDTGWTYTYIYTVPAGSDGTATVTISGTDLASNANEVATNNTFVIDNTAPTIAVTDIVGTTIEGASDEIVITFSEPVTATDTTWSDNELSIVGTTTTGLSIIGATYSPASGSTNTLTITLDEGSGEYLVNGETLTVTPTASKIEDAAGNEMLGGVTNKVEGTVLVTGDLDVPTITGIVGVGTDTIQIVFSEVVLPVDATWDLNEVASVESPDGAPLNITHAGFTIDTATDTVLTIVLHADDAAVLVQGEVILVTPAAGAVVDLAGNHLVAVEVSSGADSGWLEAWVDDSWTSSEQAGVSAYDSSLIWDTNAFDTIEEGITAVAIGGTVYVLPGTYALVEDGTVTIEKAGLTLQSTDGAAVTIIDTDELTGATPTTGFGIYINAADVTVDGFTIYNPDTSGTIGGIYCLDADHATIQYNVITFAFAGNGIDVSSQATGVTISHNVLNQFASIFLHGSDCTISANTLGRDILFWPDGSQTLEGVSITGNTFPDPTENVNGAINLFGGSAGSKIKNSLIEDNILSNRDEAGIRIGSTNPAVLTIESLTIRYNDIVNNGDGSGDNDAGIRIYDGVTWSTGNVINNNNIVGNEDYGVLNQSSYPVKAENNWWGSAVASAISTMVDGSVDYSPWLDAPYPYGEPTTTDGLNMERPISLVAGWNLISLPLVIDDTSIEAVLAELSPGVTVNVAYYTGGPDGDWLTYVAGEPGVSDLTEMSDGKGYWIDASANGVLIIYGRQLAQPGESPPTYELVAGWNLIGFTSLSVEAVTQGNYLDELASSMQAFYGYDAATGVYFVPGEGIIGSEAPDTHLVPGRGYWVAVSEPGLIFP